MSTIPTSPADITAPWLREVLGRPITAVRAENLGEGVGIMAEVTRLHLDHDDDGSDTLIVKTVSPAEQNVDTARTYGFYVREVSFYQQVADRMELQVPACRHADMGPDGVPFVILLDEITDARHIDQLGGVALSDAERVVDEIAKLHATWWDSPALDELTWLPPVNNDLYKGYAAVLPQLADLLQTDWSDRLDDAAMGWLDDLRTSYTRYLDWWIDSGPLTFAHYDLRPDNILLDAGGDTDALCLLDWQLAVRHRGTFDLSYFLGQNVPTEFRRAHQDTLVRRYHDALGANGVSGYSFDRCWDDYRYGMLMHLVSATQLQVLAGGNDRGADLLASMLTWGWQSAVDLDAGELLGEL